jgi:ABC-2 type transport system ATP-binding protein
VSHPATEVAPTSPSTPQTGVIQVTDLHKSYGDVVALRGVSFEVAAGEVFGLLGPNGAGKTSTIEILEGLRTPDSGQARVAGLDPEKSGRQLKEKIGAVLQSTNLPDKLKVHEALTLFSQFYRRSSRSDTQALLRRFQLEEKRDAFYKDLSGGQKQRLALAMALVNDPEVLFLDEPTAGLDPQVRREMYAIIEELKSEKKTILLTTHYIEEAERLCDRVAIVDSGRIIAQGTPRELKHRSAGTTRIEVRVARPLRDELLKSMDGVLDSREFEGTLVMHSSHAPHTIVALVKALEAEGNELQALEMFSPSLEDVFIELTGRRLRE